MPQLFNLGGLQVQSLNELRINKLMSEDAANTFFEYDSANTKFEMNLDQITNNHLPVYACRAWVNFNGTFNDSIGNSGTYACSSRTITCSVTSHGLSVGDSIHAAFTRSSGDTTTITDDWFVILTVPDSDTFTIQTIASTSDQAGTISYDFGDGPIRASENVSSITDNNTGDYTVNFTTAMPDANYCPVVGASPNFGLASTFSTQFATGSGSEVAPTISAVRVSFGSTAAYHDVKYASVAIFR